MSGRPQWKQEGRDWPNRDASRFVAAAGMNWHVQVAGTGPDLLLLHGTGAASHSWAGLFPLLAQRFRVIAPDLPGHGFSDMPPAGGLSLPGMAGAVGELIRELDAKPAVVIGHSAGAALAIRMSLDRIVAPSGLVSINGALMPFGGLAAQLFPPMARFLAVNPLIPRFFAWRAEDKGAVTRLIEGTGSRIDARGIEWYRRLFSTQSHVAATLGMMANWDVAALRNDLPKLDCPLLLIVGESDKAVSPEEARRTRRLIRGATLSSLRGAGHLCHEEQPDQVFHIIESFTARINPIDAGERLST
jgi:magnesium chelatase accessory protein